MFVIELKNGNKHEIDIDNAFTFVKLEQQFGYTMVQAIDKLEAFSMETLSYAWYVNLAAHKLVESPDFMTWLSDEFADFEDKRDDPKESSLVESPES